MIRRHNSRRATISPRSIDPRPTGAAPAVAFVDNVVGSIGEPGRPSRLGGYFERTCDRRPSSTALECDGEQLTYAELDRRADQLAHHLLDQGIGEGTRVGILLYRPGARYAALLGVTKTGAALVPLAPPGPGDP